MPHPLADLARAMRRHPTRAEDMLWYVLRRRPLGFKFRRQVPLGAYIADFACKEARLVVEVDGAFHAWQDADVERDAWLMAHDWEVARFTNDDVRRRLTEVNADIERRLTAWLTRQGHVFAPPLGAGLPKGGVGDAPPEVIHPPPA